MVTLLKITKSFGYYLVITKEITIFVYPLKDGADGHPARGARL